jgi:teichuronic acid biosynthesis glycosyltransferase TuaG
MKPIVSIITPAFNSAAFLWEAIESVQGQTFERWEMIVVDDCSTDDTCSVVIEYSKFDPRIRLLRQTENGGAARARNAALAAAEGRYIAFLDSDDVWLPRKLELQIAFMRDKTAALSYTLYRRFTANINKPSRLVLLNEFYTYSDLLKNTGIACLTVMLDRELTGVVRMLPLARSEDYALWLDILKRGFIAHGLQLDLARYRLSSDSVSSNKFKSALSVWHIFRNIENLHFLRSIWCFVNYVWNACFRRRDSLYNPHKGES